eukprot:CAMPEP_0171849670 /NCGR_PEP_ID=MMETSP0992-20121227/19816_1 /TAXON_ID=483369 /ORGANISM="non described non described, Strain CCMP2098" /LENGTH=61 /DNA_ID=CAMNT_0012468927 /DNA_START=239 /DNA_END=424 /DNA_ORIENTATION=+
MKCLCLGRGGLKARGVGPLHVSFLLKLTPVRADALGILLLVPRPDPLERLVLHLNGVHGVS